MPSATTTKGKVAGTKRKAEPIKDIGAKDIKKTRTGFSSGQDFKKKTHKPFDKHTDVRDESSEDDLDELEREGGVPLDQQRDSDARASDETPSALAIRDGVHPDRVEATKDAKANGKSQIPNFRNNAEES